MKKNGATVTKKLYSNEIIGKIGLEGCLYKILLGKKL